MTSLKTAPSDDGASDRAERLEARVSSVQKALFRQAAQLQGKTLSAFVVESTYEAAIRAVAAMPPVTLDGGESVRFAQALQAPPEPSSGLRAAARRYLEQVEAIGPAPPR